MPANSALASTLPIELVDRARREREFFNQHSDPARISDHLLLVPSRLEAIPPEVAACVPALAGKRVCEVGCGYGVLSAYFAQEGAQVFGFDVAETNVTVAERAARVNRVSDRVFFQVMQGECLGFAGNAFDLVFGNAVLHHLDIAVSAREIYRILKPGGVAIFREPLGENRLLEWLRNCSWRSSNHRHTADEHSLLYRDVETLRTVFPKVTFRESELLSALGYWLRKAEVGMIAVPRWERSWQYLAAVDQWLLTHLPQLGSLATYCVISLFKPQTAAETRTTPAAL